VTGLFNLKRHYIICILRVRNRTLTNREKNCRQGRYAARQDNLEVVKGFRSQGVLWRTKNFGRHCLSIQKKKIVIRTLLSS
jgi:hypothetical protein